MSLGLRLTWTSAAFTGASSMLLKNWARLYSNVTPAELAFERTLVTLNERYRAQHPFFGQYFIVDFALLDRKLIIEIDGKSHTSIEAKKKDADRDAKLVSLGWSVGRVTNEEVFDNPKRALSLAFVRAAGKDEKLFKLCLKCMQVSDTCPRNKYSCAECNSTQTKLRYHNKNMAQADYPPGPSCEICEKLFTDVKGWKRWAKGYCFDHDHITGKFRGWLCPPCNIALGLAEDNVVILSKMIRYLEKPR